MAEGTNVGNIYLDLIVRDTVEKQVQKIAAKGQAIADKAFSGVEKTVESMANRITKQATKPVEKLADTMVKSSEKMTDCFKKVSATPAEKALQKAQQLADKAAEKVRELENAIGKLNKAAASRIAEDMKIFSESVEDAQKKVDYLAEQIVDVKTAMEKKPSQTLSQTLKMLIGQYSVAKDVLKTEQAILDDQRKTAEKNVESTFGKQREKLYEQLAVAQEQSAARAAQVAQLQSQAEITAAQQTTAAIQAERVKQDAAQTSSTDPTEDVRNRLREMGESIRADAQKMIDNSLKNRLSRFAQTFGSVVQEAFTKANGSAVSFGQIVSQAFTKAGSVAGVFGGKIGMIATIAKTAGNMISSTFTKAFSKVKESFSRAKTVISKVSTAVRKLTGNFNSASRSAGRFGSRLREIVFGALIFNGISSAVRSMVNYMGEAVTASDSMKQALSNLKGAAANAASPLIQVLTPALTNLTNAAATALSYVERLLTSITGKVSNAADLAAKKAEKTAKKAERTLASFDQLNRLNGSNDSDKDSSEDEIEPNYRFKGFNSFLESILSAIEAGKWGQIGTLIADKLNGVLSKVTWDTIQEKARTWAQNFVDTLNGFIHKVDFGLIGTTIGEGLDTITTAIDTYFQGINWGRLGKGFADGMESLLDTVNWERLGRTLSDGFRAALEWFHGFVANFNFSKLGTKIGDMLKAAFDNINWPQLAEDLNAGMLGLLDALIAFAGQIEWEKVRQTISDCLEKINWGAIGTKIGELLCGIQWGDVIGTVWDLIIEYWKAKWELFVSIIVGGIKGFGKNVAKHFKEAGLNGIKGFLAGIQKLVSTFANWLDKHLITPLVDAVCNLLGIHSPSRVFAEIGENLVLGLLEGMENTWTQITTFVNNALGGIRTKFSDAFIALGGALSNIWSSIANFIRSAVNNIIGSINGMISGVTNGINSVIRSLNRLKFTIPSWFQYVPGAANLAGKSIGFNIATLTAPQIPYLADGGVIKQPTLAMVGEYSGASSNPEIVAPQSLIAETVASVMEEMMLKNQMGLTEIVSILRQILNAVVSVSAGGIRIFIGSREVFQVVVDENNRAVLRTGSSPLKR